MHVHELNPKKTLITVIIFVLLIIIGFLTLRTPRFHYQLSLKETTQMLQNNDNAFYPYQLTDVIDNINHKVVLIDIRNKFAFSRGHIPGAENISAYDLTKEKNIKHLEALADKGITVVLYGKDLLQANGPWMWFRQVGFRNVKYLLGGYDYYQKHKKNLAQTENDKSYLPGLPRYNYAKLASRKTQSTVTTTKTKKPVIIRRKKKATVASGGC